MRTRTTPSTRPRRLSARLASAAAPLFAWTIASTVIGVTVLAPGAAQASPQDSHAGMAISRSTIMARARTWVNAHVPYSQTDYHEGYRTDCSGFVSMAWDLGSSLTTWTLPSVSTRLSSTSLLRPGDILNFSEHVVLFVGWSSSDNKQHRYFDLMAESFPGPGGGTIAEFHQDMRSSYYAQFTPLRYKHVVEGSVPAPPTTTPGRPAPAKYYVDTFATAAGFLSPNCMSEDGLRCRPQGQLYAATNYVFCKKLGHTVSSGSQHNRWWLLTDLDTIYPGRSGRAYVSAFYLRNWGNDVAKDNAGRVIPNC